MPQEGSARAWLVVAGGVIAHAIPFGLVVYAFTVFFPPILEEFGAGQGAVAWIIALATALMLGASAFAGGLTDRFGARRVMVAGALLLGAGLAMSAAAQAVWHLVLTYGLVTGAGASMTFVPAIASVGRIFTARRGLALGLAAAGSGLGTIVLAPIANALIDERGWRTALLVLAVASVAALAVAAALMPPGRGTGMRGGSFAAIRGVPAFRLLLAGSLIGAFGYWVPFFFMTPYAEHHGIGSATAAAIVAAMGVANTLGRVVMGGLADRLGRLRTMRASNVMMAASMLVWPLATTPVPLIAFGLVYAVSAGTFIALLPALAGDYFGAERLGTATGAMFAAAALGTLVSAPLSGTLFDVTGTYTPSVVFASVTLAAGAVPLFLLPQPPVVAPAAAAG